MEVHDPSEKHPRQRAEVYRRFLQSIYFDNKHMPITSLGGSACSNLDRRISSTHLRELQNFAHSAKP